MVLKKLYLLAILLTISRLVVAQDIEQIQKAKPLTITGGFSANSSLYNCWGMDSRQDPFFWQLAANVNFNFYGVVNMPFSAYFAKKNKRYQTPSYKIYGISPKYKAVTVHLGYRNMTFSNYSLSGLTFYGVGVEYTPKDSWLSASAMYGRFFEAVEYGDTAKNQFKDPSYERWGGGFSITAAGKNKELKLIMFKAADRKGSISDPPKEMGITPAENFILGAGGKTQVFQKVSVSVNYTLSAYTLDTRMPEKEFQHYTYLNNLGSIFTPRFSSSFHKALESSIAYQGNSFSAGINYKRVDPGYSSLGSTFIENDVEDILLNLSKSFAENKVNISGSIGQQRNNLTNDKQTENRRVASSISASWSISQKVNLNGNYSNYTTTTQPTLINLTDSVKYFQINKNASVNFTYSTGTETRQHSFSLMVAQQKASSLNRSATLRISNDNDIMNVNVSYLSSWPQINLTGNLSVQGFWLTNGMGTTKNFGPNASIGKSVLKNMLKLTLAYGLNKTEAIDGKGTITHILRLNGDFQLAKKQKLQLQASYMQRENPSNTGVLSPKELQASLSYQYSF